MGKMLRRVRGALVVGALWAAAWGIVGGGVMELLDPNGTIEDVWPVVMAILGLLGGLFFSTVVGILGRHRRFDQLSMPQFAAWGAAAGIVPGLFAMSIGAGLPIFAVMSGACALSAAGSLKIARMATSGDQRIAGDGERPRITG